MSAPAIALALARVEGRRLVRHPFVLAAAAIPVAVLIQYLLVDGQTDVDYAWTLLVPFMPLAAAVLVAVNLAALRARRDAAEELFRSLPAPASARTAGHLVSLAWAAAAAGLLVAIPLPMFMSRGNPLPGLDVAMTTPALVVLCGALGLALARWLPHPGLGAVGVVATFALVNAGGSVGESARGIVVAGFLALGILCGAIALLRDRSRVS